MPPSTLGQLLAIGSLLAAGCTLFGPAIFFHPPDGRFEETRIKESSGVVKSRRWERVFWTHNDSDNPPLLFAFDPAGGRIGAVALPGAENVDWEDIAVDDAGFLYLCDIGNNRNVRKTFIVYKAPEVDPRVSDRAAPFHSFRFRYPGLRSPDAEACFFSRGALYILTKEPTTEMTTLYRLSLSHPEEEETVLEIGRAAVESPVTAADLSSDGALLAVLTYTSIYLFSEPGGGDNYLSGRSDRISLSFGQSEGIAWDGDDLIVTNEAGGLLRLPRMR